MTAICSVCQEKLQSGRAVVLSHCGHVLCDTCLLQWASRSNPPNRVECPMCRKKHSYPKHTIKLYFEEEKSEAEGFRCEVRAVMKLLEACAEGPSGASLTGVVNELKNLSKSGKKLGEPNVTAATINGLDAMVNHLSKKLGPVQSTEDLQASLRETQQSLEHTVQENSKLQEQYDASRIREHTIAVQAATAQRALAESQSQLGNLSRILATTQGQLAQQRTKNLELTKQLSTLEDSRDNAYEKIVTLKRKYKAVTESNEALKVQVNHALAARRTASPLNRTAAPASTSRLTRRPSIISIHSQSSPETKHVFLLTSDDGDDLASDSSDVELISDTESRNDPIPRFHELKPVKSPAALFQATATPQASSSKVIPNKSVQKRKLAATPHAPSRGLELRNGKLTGLVATGPKRSKRCGP